MKRILLLTDFPPSQESALGLMVKQLCAFLPQDALACYAVCGPTTAWTVDPEFEGLKVKFTAKPRETKESRLPGVLGIAHRYSAELYSQTVSTMRIAQEIAEFAKSFKADAIWCVLHGQTMVRLADLVPALTGLPLYSQVCAPPNFWLKENNVDPWSARRILKQFEHVLSKSANVGVASWAMADAYKEQYGLHAVPLLPSLDSALAVEPAFARNKKDAITIGVPGQIYAHAEWHQLHTMLDQVGWEIAGCKVSIRCMSHWFGMSVSGPVRMEYLGWKNQRAEVKALSECDILYCPYWSDPAFETQSRQGFPSKLTSCLAAGRPVIFHGPEYSSPSRFLQSYDAAVFCRQLSKSAIYNAIHHLIRDPQLYCQTAMNGAKAFNENLTADVSRKQFLQFLGAQESRTPSVEGRYAHAASR